MLCLAVYELFAAYWPMREVKQHSLTRLCILYFGRPVEYHHMHNRVGTKSGHQELILHSAIHGTFESGVALNLNEATEQGKKCRRIVYQVCLMQRMKPWLADHLP